MEQQILFIVVDLSSSLNNKGNKKAPPQCGEALNIG